MANKRPINKDNPKNIYCDHCKYFLETGLYESGIPVMTCSNKDSKHYQSKRYYYHRCKAFKWKEDTK